jgi:hypothetical protein
MEALHVITRRKGHGFVGIAVLLPVLATSHGVATKFASGIVADFFYGQAASSCLPYNSAARWPRHCANMIRHPGMVHFASKVATA